MLLRFENEKYIFDCEFEERHIPKSLGFNWSDVYFKWNTVSPITANRAREYADTATRLKLDRTLIIIDPTPVKAPNPPKGLVLMPHQIEAINFALSRNRSYLGLDPGLGKTIIAAMIAVARQRPAVYVTPPFLVQNIIAEFERWAPEISVEVYTPNCQIHSCDMLIMPDSLISRDKARGQLKDFTKNANVDCLIFIDEAHRVKSEKAQRTIALLGEPRKSLGVVDHFKYQVYMSGTPIPNRPMELFTILSKAAPQTIDMANKFQFGRKYCGGFKGNHGWDFSGASNIKELAAKVIAPSGPFMLRQRKDLLDLPPKIEEIFVISESASPQLAELEAKIGANYKTAEDIIKNRVAAGAGTTEKELHIATYRRLLGQEKVAAVAEFVKVLLTETKESIVLFGYHIDVIAALTDALKDFNPIVISGEVPPQKRQALVNDFQENPDRRLIIGNYLAMGIGFTITKAERAIFCEFDWVPGVNAQASDRLHRIGQTKTVLVQYCVYKNSIDKYVIETLLYKQGINQI